LYTYRPGLHRQPGGVINFVCVNPARKLVKHYCRLPGFNERVATCVLNARDIAVVQCATPVVVPHAE
jgi:hypothetical protein